MDFIIGLTTSLAVVSATGVSVVTGVAQGVSEQKRVNADASNQSRMLKFHLDASVESAHRNNASKDLRDGIVTLYDDKLWIEPKNHETGQPANPNRHPFTGFYVAYPDDKRPYTRGLVSTISRDPPMLNWVYVDKDTHECKYASRTGSIAHHVGSFDWTKEMPPDSNVTLDDFEGFVAVEESKAHWALYFDLDDDGLATKRNGRKTIEVGLVRRLLDAQEVNKWGLAGEGNIGFKKTDELKKRKEESERKESSQ